MEPPPCPRIFALPAVEKVTAEVAPVKKAKYGKWTPDGIQTEGWVVVLTKREMQILDLLLRGATNRVIANECGCSLQTAKNHVVHIMDYCDAKNRTQLSFFMQQGFLKIAESPFIFSPRIKHPITEVPSVTT
jgi:DNA-binding NarL/FixJ family response regulator